VALLALLPVAAVALPAMEGGHDLSGTPANPTTLSVHIPPQNPGSIPPPSEGRVGGPTPAGSAPLAWANLSGVSGNSPGRLDLPSMAYDPVTGTDVLFGGYEDARGAETGDSNATWSYSDAVWSELSPSTSPPNASGATMAYDPDANAFVLVPPDFTYGYDSDPPAATWEFANGTWSQLATSVVGGPPATQEAAMAYDPDSGALIRFGGDQINWDTNQLYDSNATWAFDFGSWVNVTVPHGPPGLVAPSMAYDPAAHGIVLFGGQSSQSQGGGTNETWLWSNWTWTRLLLPWSPPSVTEAQMAWDPTVGGLVLTGGIDVGGETGPGSARNSSYALVAGGWTNLTTAASFPGAVGAGIGVEPSSGSLLLFGGSVDGTADGSTWMLGREPPVLIAPSRTLEDVGVPFGLTDPLGTTAANEQIAWTFGDGGHAEGPNATHSFASPGTFTVNLTGSLSGSGGTEDGWAQTDVSVLADPVAPVALGNTFVDVNDYASATASPSLGLGPYNVSWSFGDGSGQVGGWSIQHRYLTPGNFSLSATVTDSLGGRSTSTVPVHVQPYPRVGLLTTQEAYDLGQSIHLTAATENGSAPFRFSYSGLPPGCASANVSNYTCEPSDTGAYAVQVTILDANGLHVTSGQVIVRIAPPLNGTLSLSSRVIDLGSNVTLAANLLSDGSGNASMEVRSSLPCRWLTPFEQLCTPLAAGTYSVTGLVSDLSGATVVLTPTALVVNPALRLNASVPLTPVPRGSPVELSVTVAGGTPPLHIDFVSVPRGCYALNATAYRCDLELAGTYDLTASVTDALGATATAHADVVVVEPGSGVGATPGSAPPATGSIDYVFWGLVAAAVAEIAMSARQNRSPERRWRDRVRKGLWSVFGSAATDASDADPVPGADAPP
jgi:hypothetical protein